MTSVTGARLAVVSIAALALAGCSSSGSGSYRVASVGSVAADDGGTAGDTANGGGGGGSGSGSGGSGSGSGSGSGGNGSGGSAGSGSGNGLLGGVLVTAGNTVIGVSGKHNEIANGLVIPTVGTVTGTVTRILKGTGQTLVELGSGNTLILGKAGGKLGDLLSLDLANGKVIGGPSGSPLIGLNILAANPTTGKLATVSALSGNQLISVTVPGTTNTGLLGTGGVGSILGGPVTGSASGSANAGLLGSVTGTVNTVVAPKTNGAATGTVTAPVKGLLTPVTDLLAPKPPK